MQLDSLLRLTVEKKASDLHIRVKNPPVLRIDGHMVRQQDMPQLGQEDLEKIYEEITTPEQRDDFVSRPELDFSYTVAGLARFRVNIMRQRSTLSVAFRLVPFQVLSIDELGLPQIYKELVLKPRGLILVTGPTGSGKSTTLAAMINHLNQKEPRNIITIENPIEYLHSDIESMIAQREVGGDTQSFHEALIHALRHDPDVIVLGEMRDLETISAAITAAETGHLVLGTLHTTDAAQTIDRVIDVFPTAQQQQIRLQLSQVLEAVLSQALVRLTGGGRIAACEIMLGSPAVRNVLREGQTYKLGSIIQMSANDGMLTLNQSLADLVTNGKTTQEEAVKHSSSMEQLIGLIGNTQGNINNHFGETAQTNDWLAQTGMMPAAMPQK